MKKLIIQNEGNGQSTFAIPGSDAIFHVYGITSAVTVTVPAGARFALFSSNADFYARWDGGAAVVPSSNVVDGTGSELKPAARSVEAGDTFSLIAGAATTAVTITFYS